jgi:hypothetical protein
MCNQTRCFRALTLAASVAITLTLAGTAAAQTPPPAPTTGVLATLTVKPEIPRPEVMKVLPDEVRATVRLYLDGKILQWFGRADGKGVIFILTATSTDEAKKIVADLPLDKAGMATFDYMPLTPLSPLRLLLATP